MIEPSPGVLCCNALDGAAGSDRNNPACGRIMNVRYSKNACPTMPTPEVEANEVISTKTREQVEWSNNRAARVCVWHSNSKQVYTLLCDVVIVAIRERLGREHGSSDWSPARVQVQQLRLPNRQ